MTTLTAGASASITLTSGNQISGVGAGTAVIGRAGTVQALTAGDAWRIGPYLTAQAVSITATSAMVYEQVAQVSADPSPADLGMTAAQVAATAALVSGDVILRAAIMGDSFGARCWSVTSVDTYYNNHGWVNWARAYLGGAFDVVANVAVSGATTTDIASQVDTVLALGVRLVFINGGINDSALTAAQTAANMLAIIERLRGRCVVVYLGMCAYAAGVPAKQTEANRRIAAGIAGKSFAYFVDGYKLTVDPASTTGAALATRSDDGLHLNAGGARAVGAEVAALIGPDVNRYSWLSMSAVQGYENTPAGIQLLSNPLCTTATGGNPSGAGSSGVVAGSWAAGVSGGTVTTVGSVVAQADGYGNAQRLTISAGSSGGSVSMRQTGMQARCSMGDTVCGSAEVRYTGAANIAAIYLRIACTVDGVTYSRRDMAPASPLQSYDQANDTLVLRTPDLLIPVGAAFTDLSWQAYVQFSAASAAIVLDVSRAALWKRPA